MTQQFSDRKTARLRGWFIAASTGLALCLVISAGAQERKPQVTQAPDDEELAKVGEETTTDVCGACHSVDDVYTSRKTVKQWQGVVADMVSRGASGTDEQIGTIKRYLTRYYGAVSVNSATAEELSAVLGLSAKDASAIVDYRNTNGKFADVAALLKVPGIDKAKIEEQPEALRFD